MFRKITLGLVAAASIGAAALLPSAASAGPLYAGGWGWGTGWGPSYTYVGTPYVGTPYMIGAPTMFGNACLQQRFVPTKHGMRWRTVNVCY